MKDINSLYHKLVPLVNTVLKETGNTPFPVFVHCARRTQQEQAIIYPEKPDRWSMHLVGLAVDFYPKESTKWVNDFNKKFNSWKHWKRLSDLCYACGFDKQSKWCINNDKPHFQCCYSIQEKKLSDIYYNTGSFIQVWKYLDETLF